MSATKKTIFALAAVTAIGALSATANANDWRSGYAPGYGARAEIGGSWDDGYGPGDAWNAGVRRPAVSGHQFLGNTRIITRYQQRYDGVGNFGFY